MKIPHIFEPFYRSPAVSARQIQGTGLGLALARAIAQSMGGELSVVSELGVGSTFTVHLPTAEAGSLELETTSTALSPTLPK